MLDRLLLFNPDWIARQLLERLKQSMGGREADAAEAATARAGPFILPAETAALAKGPLEKPGPLPA